MRYLNLGAAMVLPPLFAPETDRRAEPALIAPPANAGAEGRLTPCPVVGCGLVGDVGQSEGVGEGV